MSLSGASVLLTGASGGIGHAVARELSRRGARVTLTGRRAGVLEPLASELGARALSADLSESDDVNRLVADAGEVEILVSNAALPASGTLESFSIEEIDRALAVNLRAPIALAHALVPAMVARGRGHLVFMSSLAGKAATPGSALYSATKYGLRGFATALRADLRASGVGVSAIFPGFIRDAGMFADAQVRLPPGVGTSSPEDVARAVVTAIERNRGEIDVAPLPLRAGTALAGLAPEISATIARRLGSEALSRRIGAGQRDKR
ncbi:MAG: SDR family NAD(P)-dependent oxidoreductase [Actinobacteria bacterium]|nr:MAG: SDR family NAD(P)-dependent oxidoreductase [Actinomycetota bacterium]